MFSSRTLKIMLISLSALIFADMSLASGWTSLRTSGNGKQGW